MASTQPAGLAGIVLAGDRSRRPGREKAILPVAQGATTMVEHAVGIVGRCCQPVFVIAAQGQRLPAVQAQVVRDDVRGGGPLSATGRGLRAAAQAGASRAFVSTVDVPFLTAALIDELASLATQVDADVVLPWDGHDYYLAAVYRTALVERIDALVAAGERGMRALVDTVDAQRLVVTDRQSPAGVNSAADPRSLTAAGS